MYGDFSLRIGELARNVKWCSHYGKQNGGSSKKFKRELPYDPEVPLLGVYLKEAKVIVLQRYLYPHVHCNIICSSQDKETTCVYQQIEG